MSARERAAADLDRAVDGLLTGEARPAAVETAELLATARLLHDVLPRYHPRFAFEEHLARRLAAAGRSPSGSPLPGMRAADRGGDGPRLIRLPDPVAAGTDATVPTDASAHRSSWGADSAAGRRRRGLLAGGAIASGVSLAIPLAGAALVAWRRGRTASGGA